ncbi:uncharacterized protein [Venturia canescens]|uniref:uncharacterized protein n=1 Tax=Venturia canescens TaxID=32260 RepID=UPI001C9C2010|nr:uncharacterized protein LOC122417983 [Venturia canescens]
MRRKKRKNVPMEAGLPSPEKVPGTFSVAHPSSEPAPKRKREYLRSFKERKNRYTEKTEEPYVVLISQLTSPYVSNTPENMVNSKPNDKENNLKDSRHQKGIGAIHPMIVGKKLKNWSKSIKEIKRKGRNLVEIKLHSYQEANKLIDAQESLLPDSWKAYIPDSKISRLGVASDIDPTLTETEILEGIEWLSQPTRILKIERIMKVSKDSNNRINLTPTNSVKISFEGNALPEKIIIYKTRVTISPFEQQIRRCSNCQRFGHLSKQCRGSQRCTFCGGNHHQTECKSTKPICANCGESHPANDTKCITYIKLKITNKLKALLNIDREEALEIIKKNRLDNLYRLESWLQKRTESQSLLTRNEWFITPRITKEFASKSLLWKKGKEALSTKRKLNFIKTIRT